MAYFDSPKNRAMWEIELGELKKMKADFESGKLAASHSMKTNAPGSGADRKPVTLEQLVREEQREKNLPEKRTAREAPVLSEKALTVGGKVKG